MPIDKHKYDHILCKTTSAHGFSAQMIPIFRAIIGVESSFMPRAYRYEPALFQTMKEKDKYWADKDPSIVAASYGLAQVLFTTAWFMGMRPKNWKTMKHGEFQQLSDMMYDPERNLGYQAQLFRCLIDAIWKEGIPHKFEHLSAVDVALARYNGGSAGNPNEAGVLRNQKYVDKVWRVFEEGK